jgi:hypothetical protein
MDGAGGPYTSARGSPGAAGWRGGLRRLPGPLHARRGRGTAGSALAHLHAHRTSPAPARVGGHDGDVPHRSTQVPSLASATSRSRASSRKTRRSASEAAAVAASSCARTAGSNMDGSASTTYSVSTAACVCVTAGCLRRNTTCSADGVVRVKRAHCAVRALSQRQQHRLRPTAKALGVRRRLRQLDG